MVTAPTAGATPAAGMNLGQWLGVTPAAGVLHAMRDSIVDGWGMTHDAIADDFSDEIAAAGWIFNQLMAVETQSANVREQVMPVGVGVGRRGAVAGMTFKAVGHGQRQVGGRGATLHDPASA